MDYKKIISLLKEAFIFQERFQGYKKVIEYHDKEESFLGDIYNFYIREVSSSGQIRYSVITSPYDMTWSSAPQQALVFEEGKLIFSADFSEAVDIRTGAMDALFLSSIGIHSLHSKKILLVGSGKTARYSYLFLKAQFADLPSLDYTNRSGPNASFGSLGDLQYVDNPDLSNYDIILLHAHVDAPYMKEEYKEKLKPGVIITSYGGKTPERDIAPGYFHSDVMIFVDSHANIENLKPLSSAIDKEQISRENIIDLGEFLKGDERIAWERNKSTVFISGGTPIQNIAMIQYLMQNR